jgi:hypothetical protein
MRESVELIGALGARARGRYGDYQCACSTRAGHVRAPTITRIAVAEPIRQFRLTATVRPSSSSRLPGRVAARFALR